MRAVAIKSEERQGSRALEQSRELLVKQRTQPVNSLRAMLAEFGIVDRTKAVVKADPDMRRASRIPSVGFPTAHAAVAAVGDGRQFACGRAFTSLMGMTPRENSSAGKRRTGG